MTSDSKFGGTCAKYRLETGKEDNNFEEDNVKSVTDLKKYSSGKFDVCLTVHHQYNDVSNQQDATTFSFINLFKSTLRVSGDKFFHSQEHFLTVYTAFGTMHRHCCRPVPWLRWNVG